MGFSCDTAVYFQAKFHEIFEPYGLIYGVQVFASQLCWRGERTENQTNTTGAGNPTSGGFYAFVTFYSSTAATKAKEDLNSVLLLGENECKVWFADRQNEPHREKTGLLPRRKQRRRSASR